MTLKSLIKIALCLIFLFVNNADAQQATTGFDGQITKFYGEAASDAAVTIRLNSKKNRFTRTARTDNKGKYSFSNIPAGSYRIFVSDSNGLTYENLSFDAPANQTARLDIKLEYGGDCTNSGGNPLVLTENNKAGIFNEVLRDILLKNQIALIEQLKGQTVGIILSSDNIKAEWLKPLKNVRLNLLSNTEIRQKAAGDTQFMYLSFGAFKVKGNCVVVPVSNMWAVDMNFGKTRVSGGGKVYVYSKKGGKFRLKTSGRWKF